jgi:hypothetical protein
MKSLHVIHTPETRDSRNQGSVVPQDPDTQRREIDAVSNLAGT